jgi:hypothetical protein
MSDRHADAIDDLTARLKQLTKSKGKARKKPKKKQTVARPQHSGGGFNALRRRVHLKARPPPPKAGSKIKKTGIYL